MNYFVYYPLTLRKIWTKYRESMRKSNSNNCLVLISDHTKDLYEDKWHGDVLHYTGMGKVGDQDKEWMQNGTLYHSPTNGVVLYLFEVLERKQYTYRGIVELCGEPYTEFQPDENGDTRKVWMFPIRPVTGAPTISAETLQQMNAANKQKAEGLSMAALRTAAKNSSTSNPGTRNVESTEVVRNPYVSEYAKRLANGKCSLCEKPAPFADANGKPYLETHHVIWLAEGGADSVDNAVALCPNCHRKMHIVKDPADIAKLLSIAKQNALQ